MTNKTAEATQPISSQIIGDGTNDVSVVVGRLLMKLLFKSKLLGTTYLKEAVLYRYEKAECSIVSLTKDVYPTVANKLSTTVNRVERAIRNAISDCHEHGNLLAFNDLIHSEVIKEKYPPTNGELISVITSWLQLERQQNHIK